MDVQGKSDLPIVPAKPSNKAALAAAETVEGRGGAKGNAVQGGTCQTQGWESVSLALERIREAARRDKRARFTALLHHVSVELLRYSALQLKRGAAPGIDGITWEAYEADLESNLRDLHERIHRAAIERSHHVGSTSLSLMAGSGRWASLPWRTRSSNERWRRC